MRALGIVGFGALAGCSTDHAALKRFEYTQIIMGVEARIILYAQNQSAAVDAARAGFGRMAQLDGVLSDYRPGSEALRLSARAGDGPILVSDDLFEVLDRSLEISLASDGAFDVTVGPVVGLWREARKSGRLPPPENLARARSLVGWRNVTLDPQARAVELARPGMQLDFGGIGKGFAADQAIETINRLGIDRCLVDLGGDIRAGAPPPDHSWWSVGVEAGDEVPRQSIHLNENAVATSGDTEQFIEIAGVRYSHIVDPRTGIGLTNRIAVTVIAPDAATADALASAISVLGPEAGLALLEALPGTSASVRLRTDTGVVTFASDTFPHPAYVR